VYSDNHACPVLIQKNLKRQRAATAKTRSKKEITQIIAELKAKKETANDASETGSQ
jgi:hypothetical protein